MGAPVARVRAATSVVAGGRGGRPVPVGTAGLEMDSGSILAPLMEKLMETGHMEEFVEQVRKLFLVKGVGFSFGIIAHVCA